MQNQDWNPIVFKKNTKDKEKVLKTHKTNYNNIEKKIDEDNYVLPKLNLEQRNKIIQGRKNKNWTQKQLSNFINEPQNIISGYENGSLIYDKKIISKINKALNIKIL